MKGNKSFRSTLVAFVITYTDVNSITSFFCMEIQELLIKYAILI